MSVVKEKYFNKNLYKSHFETLYNGIQCLRHAHEVVGPGFHLVAAVGHFRGAMIDHLHNLKVLFKGDPVLINTYHGLCLPKGNGEAQVMASKFIDFLSSEDGQKIIGEYGKSLYGEAMYNDAEYAKQYDH